MLFLVVVVASRPLIPRQPARLLGAEIFVIAAATLVALVPVQLGYLRLLEPVYRPRSNQMVRVNRPAMALLALAGFVILCRGDAAGFYVLAAGILLTFVATGASAWVLLIEINRQAPASERRKVTPWNVVALPRRGRGAT